MFRHSNKTSTHYQSGLKNSKCVSIHPNVYTLVLLVRHSPSHRYITYISSHIIQQVSTAKYFGVTIASNLSWSSHITNIINKTNSIRAFLQRNLKHCTFTVKSACYRIYVRSILEYTSTVWSPHLLCDINRLEMVLHYAARLVCNDYMRYSSVKTMLTKLNWPTLQQRRQHFKNNYDVQNY